MSVLLDTLLVGTTVLAALLYVIKALAPRARRQRAGQKIPGACSACDQCAPPAASNKASGTETRVPLADIGHR